MSFSPKTIANIKRGNDSDQEVDDHDNSLLSVLRSFPETTTSVTAPIVEIVPSCENFKQEKPDASVDPLLDNPETYLQNCFVNAYQDSDILKSDDSDNDEAGKLDATSRPSKKMRLQAELKGRNGYTWSTNKNFKSATTKSFDSALKNIQPIGKGPAQAINNILEIWSLLIDEQIISQTVNYTNIAIKKRKGKLAYQRLIDAAELRAWIGLNYLCGIFRNAEHNGPLDELWSLELGNAIFRATMSLKRFEFILANLRFGDNLDEPNQNLQIIKNLWSIFLINCRSYYAPSGNCCVDEVILNFPIKKDINRLLVMCDVKTLYMCNAVFSTSGEYRERDILRIVSDLKSSKRNIVLPTQFTCVDLANKLYQMEISVVGILANAAKEIPTEFIANRSIDTLYSDTVNIRLSQHNFGIILYSGNLSKNINIENLYGLSCNACQNYQKSSTLYSTKNATLPDQNSWAVSFFQNILDYAAFNAWILFTLSTHDDRNMKQRDFQRHLGLYLTQQQLKRELHSDRLKLPQKVQISEILGESTDKLFLNATSEANKFLKVDYIPNEKVKIPDGVQILPKNLKTRLRCRKCPSSKSRKTKTRCQQCLLPLCQQHFVQRCRECTGLPDENTEKDTDEADQAVMSGSDEEHERDDSDH